MKSLKKFFLIFCIAAVGIGGCNTDSSKSHTNESGTTGADSAEGLKKEVLFDPDTTDTIAPPDYVVNAADTASASLIRKVLPGILEKQLVGVDPKDRRFVYYQTDLNGDGKDELFVGFTGMNWCGSGGCTALLLSADGKLITYFTVVNFPIRIMNEKTNGWNDLVAYSGGANRVLKCNKNKYPSNPSVAPKYQAKLGDEPKALGFAEKPYPWFTF